MKLSPRQKKWGKRILIFLILRMVLGTAFYYVVVYQFKKVAQIAIKKESKGLYAFDASDIDVSLWKKTIVFHDPVLHCTDTVHTPTYYDIKIPRVYIAIASWKDLIFHKKVSIDSLSIRLPDFKVHEMQHRNTANMSFRPSQILDLLQKLILHLQVRSLDIQSGSFVYNSAKSHVPFKSNHINFVIKNFSKKTDQSDSVFSAEDIDLSIDNQNWLLPDGIHTISFKKFHFSGRKQMFELDSCSFHAAAGAGKGEMTLHADKLFFNSRHLSAIYEKNELLIDTLVCYKPVLAVETTEKNKPDSSHLISQSLTRLFKNMKFNYIDIKDGQFVDINKYAPNYITQKANLKIYNLNINADNAPHIKTDSIQLALSNIQFMTTDSLFQMTVGDLALDNNDIIFKNAVYSPTPWNHSIARKISFTTPSLRLKNIDLEALLSKHLKAKEAELYKPVINLYDRNTTKKKSDDTTGGMVHFYRNLHGLKELISVQDFHIVNGNLNYTSVGISPAKMTMKNLNADVLLNNFFISDSLIDIKRSLPMLHVNELNLHSPKADLHLKNYSFDGSRRHNSADQLNLSLANGTSIKGKKLYWEVLDWDLYANHKIIQIDHMKVNELAVISTNAETMNKEHVAKNLPVIHIGRIDLDHLSFNHTSANSRLHFEAQDICTDHINSVKNYFIWQNAQGIFKNIVFTNQKTNVSISNINFNNEYETVLDQASVTINKDSSYVKLQLPVLKLKSNLQSSDFSQVPINSLMIDRPQIKMLSKLASGKQNKTFTVPLNFTADNFSINDASVNYRSQKDKDTSAISAIVNMNAKALQAYKTENKFFHYGKVAIDVSNLQLAKKNLSIHLPQSSAILTKGNIKKDDVNKLDFVSGIVFNWNDAAIKNNKTDSTELSIEKLSGVFSDTDFSFEANKKLAWQPFVNRTTISKGNIHLKSKKLTADIDSLYWNSFTKTFNTGPFSIVPNISMQQAFDKAAWQTDYITVKGNWATLSGLQYNYQTNDSSIIIRKIVLDKIDLTAARDKRIPFKRGIEKPMPTKLINTIRFPLQVDSLLVQQSAITVHEASPATNKWGVIPLEAVNVCITNLTNIPDQQDSLAVTVNAQLLNNRITHFTYKESYGDSLSGFFVHNNVSPMQLPTFSKVTVPMAAVSVDQGSSDTLYASWYGNKYAAIGEMNLYYKDLKVQLLNAKDPSKKKIKLSIENWLANNFILRKKNGKPSTIFFERDREKFIFNYWIKTVLKGTLSSIGLKSNKKYLKQYRKLRVQYSLPENKN